MNRASRHAISIVSPSRRNRATLWSLKRCSFASSPDEGGSSADMSQKSVPPTRPKRTTAASGASIPPALPLPSRSAILSCHSFSPAREKTSSSSSETQRPVTSASTAVASKNGWTDTWKKRGLQPAARTPANTNPAAT